MKKITLLFILSLTLSFVGYSQCTTSSGGQWPPATIELANSGGAETIATNNYPNAEFSLIDNVLPGSDYTVAATGPNPSVFITVTNTADDSVITSGLDTVSFTAPVGVTGLTIYWHLNSFCGVINSGNTLTTIQCTTCACTETEAPSAATDPAPEDAATGIPIDYSDPANLLITPFSWTDGILGGSVESYNLSLGITPTGDDIGTISNATNGNGINYDWDPNTTYFWTLEAVNCFGNTDGTVWSFTTADCVTTAPTAVSVATAPTDGALDIPIDITDPAALLVTPFSWEEPTTGELPESYNINLGITPAGGDIGTISGATNGNGINYTWEYSTTYFWSVDAFNCFGSSAGPIWSFTTAADPDLSVNDFDANSLTYFYNKNLNQLSVNSSQSTLNSIEVFDILVWC